MNNCVLTILEKTKPLRDEYIILGDAIEGVGTESNEDDWRILYYDSASKTTYAILADYLPNDTGIVSSAGLLMGDGEFSKYGVKGDTREDFIARLRPIINDGDSESIRMAKTQASAAWKTLIYSDISSINGVQVYGALTRNEMNNIKGNTYPSADSRLDYNNHKCYGYWLATTGSTSNDWSVYCIDNGCSLSNSYSCKGTIIGICPVVILPSNVTITKENGKWIVD